MPEISGIFSNLMLDNDEHSDGPYSFRHLDRSIGPHLTENGYFHLHVDKTCRG